MLVSNRVNGDRSPLTVFPRRGIFIRQKVFPDGTIEIILVSDLSRFALSL